jgi:hypothetical protein
VGTPLRSNDEVSRPPQKGFLKQEEIPFDALLSTRTGSLYAISD